jgi:hypothetical protein
MRLRIPAVETGTGGASRTELAWRDVPEESEGKCIVVSHTNREDTFLPFHDSNAFLVYPVPGERSRSSRLVSPSKVVEGIDEGRYLPRGSLHASRCQSDRYRTSYGNIASTAGTAIALDELRQ